MDQCNTDECIPLKGLYLTYVNYIFLLNNLHLLYTNILFERYLSHLKSHVTNKAQPEGSIAEGYLLEETIRFCSRYLQGVKTIFNMPKRMDDDISNSDDYLFNSGGRVIGKEVSIRLDGQSLKQAHRYVLLHSDEIKGDLE